MGCKESKVKKIPKVEKSEYSIRNDYDYLLKLLFVGDSGVGKSSMLLKFTDNTFNDTFISTIGVDFKIKSITVCDKTVKLQIWDTAGQERFRTITSSYYRGAHAVIIVYDITNRSTFANVDRWLSEIKKYSQDNVLIFLVGNKSDLKERKVSKEEGQDWADRHEVLFFETSAKNGEHIDDLFNKLAECLCKRMEN